MSYRQWYNKTLNHSDILWSQRYSVHSELLMFRLLCYIYFQIVYSSRICMHVKKNSNILSRGLKLTGQLIQFLHVYEHLHNITSVIMSETKLHFSFTVITYMYTVAKYYAWWCVGRKFLVLRNLWRPSSRKLDFCVTCTW